jgi:hypothetical protein
MADKLVSLARQQIGIIRIRRTVDKKLKSACYVAQWCETITYQNKTQKQRPTMIVLIFTLCCIAGLVIGRKIARIFNV